MHTFTVGREFLYVHNIGLFQVIDNDGQGGCLFRSISQALHKYSQDFHMEIRKSVVRYISKRKMWNRLGEQISRFWKLDSIPTAKFSLSQRLWGRCFRMNGTCGSGKGGENKWKYRQLMSRESFPGTSYELRAAANYFGFHVDFLVDMSCMTRKRYTPTAIDDHIRLYQFFSCRNNGCQVSVTKQCPHLYFLHRQNSQSEGGGHWELMLPRVLLLNTMPLHQKIYAVSSIGCRQLKGVDVNDRRDLLRRMNEIGRDIDVLVSNNNIMPYEDPEWPPDDGDNFIGCAQINYKNKRKGKK